MCDFTRETVGYRKCARVGLKKPTGPSARSKIKLLSCSNGCRRLKCLLRAGMLCLIPDCDAETELDCQPMVHVTRALLLKDS